MTGGAGRFISNTLALPYDIATDKVELKRIPVARRLIGQPSEYKMSTEYRENIGHVYQLAKRIKEYPGKANELKKDKTYRLIATAKKAESRLKKLNKFKKMAKTEEAKDRIDKKMDALKKRFNKQFLSRRKM